ncbi:MAG: substrate-binding domain-containing protein [Anaerolineae bacterium]|nr:substrate-binding domain-containing protein [Anaerolineae bacterium]
MPSQNRPRKRPTIGLLIDNVAAPEGAHQTRMWSIVAAAAEEMDVNLICFLGGMLGGYAPLNEFEYQRNIVYRLATQYSVEGLIVTSTIGTLIPYEQFHAYCKSFHPLPVVSLGTPLPGIPSIVVQHDIMRDLVTHFIEVHGHNRIGFVRGTETSVAAEKRYHAYLETLARYDIPIDPALVAPGNLLTSAGAEAVELFLDTRNLRPGKDIQSVITASDNMALGVIEALRQRGIEVPDEIAVAGVDDIEAASTVIPSLTTVRHALHEMGSRAVETLLTLLAGEQVPEIIMLPEAELVLRQSCGCFYRALQQMSEAPAVPVDQTLKQALSVQRDHIIGFLEEALSHLSAKQHPISEWAAQLLDSFTAGLEDTAQSPNPFLQTLDGMLRQTIVQRDDDLSWYKVASVLRHYTLPYLKNESLSKAIDLWQRSVRLIGDIKYQIEKRQKLRAEQQAETLRDVCEAMITTFDIASLMESIAQQLPRLGIERCFVSLYEHDLESTMQKPGSPTEWSRLILAYEGNVRHELEQGGKRYPTYQIVPPELLSQEKRQHLLVDSLYFREQQFGFIVFEAGPPEKAAYAPLRTQISAALKTAFLQQDYKRAEQNLARSNQELEQFAYISSHDLQEPLRMVRSYLQLLERRYQGQLDADADEFIDFATDGAARMQSLIKALLQYSRVTTRGGPFEPTDCNKVLQHALANLDRDIEESGAEISSVALPTIPADGVQLIQLFQNLISNAIRFRGEKKPDIFIEAQHKYGEWLFSIRDNGIGIDSEYFEYIFRIFQRLHSGDKYPGTGIGLALCKKIVERHGGRIWVESDPGQGTTFCFTIPDREQEDTVHISLQES